MELEDRSRWAVSRGMGIGMVVLGPNPLQSTLVRLKLSKRPKLSTSQWQPGWQFFTALDWTETSSDRPSHRRSAIMLWRENRFSIYIWNLLKHVTPAEVRKVKKTTKKNILYHVQVKLSCYRHRVKNIHNLSHQIGSVHHVQSTSQNTLFMVLEIRGALTVQMPSSRL